MTEEWIEEERKKEAARAKEWKKNNPEKVKEQKRAYYLKNRETCIENSRRNYARTKEEVSKRYYANRERQILHNIRRRARLKSLPFDLEVEDIMSPEVCPILGLTLERSFGRGHQRNSPSVDKIRPELGYVKGNVQVISQKANTMKADATPEELRMFAKWILKTFPEEPDVQT